MLIFTTTITFVLLFPLAVFGKGRGLHYECIPQSVSYRELHTEKSLEDIVLTEDKLKALKMSFNLIYLDHESVSLVVEQRGGRKYKSALVLYGEYTTDLVGKYRFRRLLGNSILEIIGDAEMDLLTREKNLCRSYFCASSILMDYSPERMERAFNSGYRHYAGGIRGGREALGRDNFTNKVILGLQSGDALLLEKVFDEELTFFIFEVPEFFALHKSEPDMFFSKLFMIDEIFGILESTTQFLNRQEIPLTCLRRKDLDEREILQIFVLSETTKSSIRHIDNILEVERGPLHREAESSSEGVMQAFSLGGFVYGLWRMRKFLSPFSAFVAGLGLGPVAASDLCSPYLDSEMGKENFKNLTPEMQKDILQFCPEYEE